MVINSHDLMGIFGCNTVCPSCQVKVLTTLPFCFFSKCFLVSIHNSVIHFSGVSRGAHTPRLKIFSISCISFFFFFFFLENLANSYVAASLEGCCSLLRGILDPPRHFQSRKRHVKNELEFPSILCKMNFKGYLVEYPKIQTYVMIFREVTGMRTFWAWGCGRS